jgi:hypothetical protein
MSARVPARPVLPEKCRRYADRVVAAAPAFTAHQRAVIGAAFRSGRRLGCPSTQRGSDAA